jgi:hypothetical protein
MACIREALADFQSSFDTLLGEILTLCKPGTLIRTMTLYTRSLHEVYGHDEDLQPFYTPLNTTILEVASLHGIPVARVHEAFGSAAQATGQGDLNAAGWNPTAAGAQLIADLHRALGYERTSP